MNIPGPKPPVPSEEQNPNNTEVKDPNVDVDQGKPDESPETAPAAAPAAGSAMTQTGEGLGEQPARDATGAPKEGTSLHPRSGKGNAPSDWIITATETGIQARNRHDNATYEGSIADFNAMLRD